MALPEEYLLSPEERQRRLRQAALTTPQVRVAFGNKGLTGVEAPTPLNQPSGSRDMMFKYGRDDVPANQPSLSVPPPSPINTSTFKLPDEMTHPILQAPKPNLTGLSPLDRNIAVLDAQREAANQFPSSRVTNEGEIEPPKMHHGFKDRAKSFGKGFLLGLPGGLGAAVAMGTTGAISPVTIDKVMAQRALQRRTAEVDQQMDIEARRAQLDKLRHPELQKPVYETRADEQGNEIRQQWNPRTGKLEDVIGPDGKPVIVKRSTTTQEKDVELPDGRIVRKQADGTYKEVYKAPEKPDVVDVRQQAERKRKYDAAQQELASLTKAENRASVDKEMAAQSLASLEQRYNDADDAGKKALQPQLESARQRYNAADKVYSDFGEKKTKAQKDIAENAPDVQESAPSGNLTIEGAIEHFKKAKGRAPTEVEINNMKTALGQSSGVGRIR